MLFRSPVDDATPYVAAPLLISAFGIISSIIATLTVKTDDGSKVHAKLEMGTRIAGILTIIASFGIIKYLGLNMGIFYAIVAGLVAGLVIAYFTGVYTDTGRRAVNRVSNAGLRHHSQSLHRTKQTPRRTRQNGQTARVPLGDKRNGRHPTPDIGCGNH